MQLKTLLQALFLAVLATAVYLWFSGKFVWDLGATSVPYFTLLAESFLARRYDLIHPPANPFDLSVYQGAVYLPWGPLPAVMIAPFVAVFTTGLSDRVYTAAFGALNVGLFFLVVSAFNQLLPRRLRTVTLVVLTLLFAFGSVHFSASSIGRVWFASQVLSLTPFLASLLFLFLFLNTRTPVLFIVAVGLFGLAIMGRLWYATAAAMYLYAFFITPASRRQRLAMLLSSGAIALFLIRMYAVYNLRRFGSVFATGYSYQHEAEYFANLRALYGRYNPRYVLTNMWYELFKPLAFKPQFPFIKPDPVGNGLLATTPALLLLGWFVRVRNSIQRRRLIILLLLGAVPYGVQVLFFFGTGFFQFGPRYLLEIVPLLILLVMFVVPFVPRALLYALVAVSVGLHALGTVWFVLQF